MYIELKIYLRLCYTNILRICLELHFVLSIASREHVYRHERETHIRINGTG